MASKVATVGARYRADMAEVSKIAILRPLNVRTSSSAAVSVLEW